MHIAHSAILISCCMASSALTALAVQSGTQPETSELVRCKRIEIVDSAGRTRVVLGDFSALGKDEPDFEPELIYGLAIQAPGQDDPAIVLIGARDYASIRASTSTGYSADMTVTHDHASAELSDASAKNIRLEVAERDCDLEIRDEVRGRVELGSPNMLFASEDRQKFIGLRIFDTGLVEHAHFDVGGAHSSTPTRGAAAPAKSGE